MTGNSRLYPDADLPIAGGSEGWRTRFAPLTWWDDFARVREDVLLDFGYNTARAYWGDLDDVAYWCAERGFNPLVLTEQQVRQYVALLRRRKYSESTIRRRVTALRKFFRALAPDSDNPAEHVIVPRPKSISRSEGILDASTESES